MAYGPQGLQLFQRQRKWPVVLDRNILKVLKDFFVPVLADEPSWCLNHLDYNKAENAHHDHETAASEVKVTPSHVILSGALSDRRVRITAVVAHEGPGEETGDGVPNGPPEGHKCHKPGPRAGKKFQKVCRIQDIVTAGTCRIDRDPNVQSACCALLFRRKQR